MARIGRRHGLSAPFAAPLCLCDFVVDSSLVPSQRHHALGQRREHSLVKVLMDGWPIRRIEKPLREEDGRQLMRRVADPRRAEPAIPAIGIRDLSQRRPCRSPSRAPDREMIFPGLALFGRQIIRSHRLERALAQQAFAGLRQTRAQKITRRSDSHRRSRPDLNRRQAKAAARQTCLPADRKA